MKILNWTQKFFAMGIGTIPLYHRSKIPALPSWEEFKTRLPTHTEYKSWHSTDWSNYGVVAGWRDLMFLDFDDHTAFAMWLDWFLMLNKHEEIYPMPFIVATARGAHVYLSCPFRGANERRLGCDVKFHGYVVGPGSTHPSGTQYVGMTELRLVQVFSLPTILPDDLFPRVVPEPVQCAADFQFKAPTTEYLSDPFAAASMDTTDLITKIKRSVRIESLFPDARRTSADGRWLAAKCIFHDDANPSFWIDTVRQLCGCQVCGFKPLDVVNLYSKMHNISNSAAVTALAQEVGIWR